MATIRENAVVILSDAIKSATYVEGSLVATKGQPTREPVTINIHDGVLTALVHSGRKKSKPVAEVFVNRSKKMMTTQGGSAGRPDELNFTFSIDLEFANGKVSRLNLGQGNRMGVRNNWWAGTDGSLAGYKIESSTWKGALIDVDAILKGRVPPKFQGLVDTLNKTILKDLFQEVNVFKVE